MFALAFVTSTKYNEHMYMNNSMMNKGRQTLLSRKVNRQECPSGKHILYPCHYEAIHLCGCDLWQIDGRKKRLLLPHCWVELVVLQ